MEENEDLDFMGELPIEFLSKIFPEISNETISQVFEKCSYIFENTIDELIRISKKDENKSGTFVPPQPIEITTYTGETKLVGKRAQVCRHFLEGNCFRKDCWFSHSLDTTVCKFWLRGNCLNGDSCPFLHRVDTETITDKMSSLSINEINTVNPLADKIENKEEFPDLKPAMPKMGTGSGFWATNKIASKSQAISGKIKYLSDRLPWVPNQILMQYLNSTKNNEINALSILQQRFPRPHGYGSSKTVKEHKPLKQRIKKIPKRPEPNLPWVETGLVVGQAYQKYRDKASELARERNSNFEKARVAFLTNKMAQARGFSIEGQRLNLLMKEQHNLAAQAIFNERKRYGGQAVLDLHGLHVQEAIAVLEESLTLVKKEIMISGNNRLYIITGTGHHSKQNPRLLPKVLDYLDGLRITYFDCSVDGSGGMLRIEV